jgi:Tfp pilus assembly protein PilX
MQEKKKQLERNAESGAALVTVVLVSFLLLTACVAMLTAVGANSRNTTDVLSETKAYYASESGLQATVNVLRNTVEADTTQVTYSEAVNDPDLSTWLPYNWPTGSPNRIVVGEAPGTYNPNAGAAYSIVVSDPDNTAASSTFTTIGGIAAATGTAFVASRTYGTSPNTTTISYADITTATTITHPDPSESLGSFSVTNTGTGAAITPTRFRIDYVMSSPRPGTLSIGGELRMSGSNIIADFDAPSYTILGGPVALSGLNGANERTLNPVTTPGVAVLTQIDSVIGPILPYRLKVVSTGYGPNGSLKKLEAVVQKNLFNGLTPPGPNNLVGGPCPVGQVCFSLGTSNGITYNGCSALGCGPSIVVTDPNNLDYINSHPPGGNPAQMTPPPTQVNVTSLPPWMSNPQNLDVLVDQIRTAAQNSGRYFISPSGNLMNPGNFAAGSGITFCEGSCQVGGSGGGVLVVTGRLTNLGGFDFRGMIIVTGEEGWLRNGGGNGQVIGNVIVAPYNRLSYVPENLSSTFLPPRYVITGGGGSDIIGGDIAPGFDATSGISDFVAGVAEK